MTDATDGVRETKLARLYDRYERRALDTGQRLQGEFFLRLVEEFDELDEAWTDGWLRWIYGDQYNRGVLDDKTRILPIVGYCVILDDQGQLPNHMRSAMRAYRAFMRDMGHLDLDEPVFRGDARER